MRQQRTTARAAAISTAAAVLLLFVATPTFPTATAYPVIVQVDEKSERCFRFNIPEDDE